MARQLVGQVDSLVSSPLWHHDNAANLLHLGVVWWTSSIQVASNLEQEKGKQSVCVGDNSASGSYSKGQGGKEGIL